MAAFAGQLAWRLGLRRRIAAALHLPGSATRSGSADLGTAGALAGVGLGGLFGLPILMLASLILEAPLAAPAAIALGFLATAHALVLGRSRQAAAWSFAVLAGLVAWTLLFVLGEGRLSLAGLAAALIAPLFAAAPAFARRMTLGKADPRLEAARKDIACLDDLAPSEAVLILDRHGRLLAATRAGHAVLALSADAAGYDVGHDFEPAERPALLRAIAGCREGETPVELTLRRVSAGERAPPIAVAITARGAERVMLRLRPSAEPATRPVALAPAEEPAAEAPVVSARLPDAPLSGDMAEAVAFAWRRVQPTAEAKDVQVVFDLEPGLLAACDRRDLRRILCLLLDGLLRSVAPDEKIVVSARCSRGAILLRALCATAGEETAASLRDVIRGTPLEEVVDHAAGTIVVDDCDVGASVSVRLAVSTCNMAEHP